MLLFWGQNDRLDDGAKVSSITKIMKTGEETQELAETEVDTEEAKG